MSYLARVAAVAVWCWPACGQAATFETLHQFGGSDGAAPVGRPVLDRTGLVYGTTLTGGVNGGGTVFRLDPASGQLTTLYAFTTSGTGGANPAAGLVFGANGVLYGTTQVGGESAHCSQGCGTIFKLVPSTGKLTTLYRFTGLDDGYAPSARLVFDASGQLYGTTLRGGSFTRCNTGCGTVFRIDPKTKVLTTLHQFGATTNDGAFPSSAVVFDAAGLLYGTASSGGTNGSGVVYEIDPATAAFSVLHDFDYHVDGAGLDSDLVTKNGVLYGTTDNGGPTKSSDGTVFSLDLASGQVTTLYSFSGTPDGQSPQPGVTFGKNGKLYGTCDQGGSGGSGTAFSLSPGTLKFSLLHDFADAAGAIPMGGLAIDKAGALYGVTFNGDGTVFKIVP